MKKHLRSQMASCILVVKWLHNGPKTRCISSDRGPDQAGNTGDGRFPIDDSWFDRCKFQYRKADSLKASAHTYRVRSAREGAKGARNLLQLEPKEDERNSGLYRAI